MYDGDDMNYFLTSHSRKNFFDKKVKTIQDVFYFGQWFPFPLHFPPDIFSVRVKDPYGPQSSHIPANRKKDAFIQFVPMLLRQFYPPSQLTSD